MQASGAVLWQAIIRMYDEKDAIGMRWVAKARPGIDMGGAA